MVALGFVLYQLSRAVADILDWLLPLMYGDRVRARRGDDRSVATRSPGSSARKHPSLRSPAATAFLYGMFLAPMTLPCTGPIVVSAFVIGSVSGSDALADSLVYFVFYALGFGWPLVVLPMLAAPAQRQITRFLAVHHRIIEVLVRRPADRASPSTATGPRSVRRRSRSTSLASPGLVRRRLRTSRRSPVAERALRLPAAGAAASGPVAPTRRAAKGQLASRPTDRRDPVRRSHRDELDRTVICLRSPLRS